MSNPIVKEMVETSGLNIPDGIQSNSEDGYQEETDPLGICLELFTILSMVCIACNIIIGFVIIKYRRLRREKSNIILLNWTIVNSLFILFLLVSIWLPMYWEIYFVATDISCTLQNLVLSILLANLLLIILLFIDWFLKLYYTVTYQKFEKNLMLILVALYVCTALCIGSTMGDCYFTERGEDLLLHFFNSYVTFIVFMIIMNIVHFVKKGRLIDTTNVSYTPLYLTNTYFLSVCPLFILVPIILRCPGSFFNAAIDSILICGTLVLALMAPIYLLVILLKCEREYKKFLGYIFCCKCFNYKDAELQEESVGLNGSMQ
ncbi:hypothetical protein JTB14_001007 [Gonioctena quinquepunctata]|nr:hypothetical protein JTB14_001007 [Gonioctena quinquepunctata]